MPKVYPVCSLVLAVSVSMFVIGCDAARKPPTKGTAKASGAGSTTGPSGIQVPQAGGAEEKPAAKTENSAAAEMKKAKADVTTTLADLVKEFNEDSKAVKDKYAGKVVEVTGPLASFRRSDSGSESISLGTGYDISKGNPWFTCELAEPFAYEQIAPGQEVVVRGKGSSVFGATFEKCVIVKTTPREEPSKKLSVEELVKACFDAGDKFESDWQNATVMVTGKFMSAEVDEYVATVKLAGSDENVVSVQMYSATYGRLAKLEQLAAGQVIQVQGSVLVTDPVDKTVYLKKGWIVKDGTK